MKKKKFRLVDAILGTVCLTLVCESVMPTAAIGNTQYFWWIFLLIAFCLPYGMITAELGTTYPSEGGMYDWVKRAFGPKWAGRVAWNYWVNFPLWIASLAVAVTDVVAGIFDVELSYIIVYIKKKVLLVPSKKTLIFIAISLLLFMILRNIELFSYLIPTEV